MVKRALNAEAQDARQLPPGWLEIGRAMVVLVCKRLDIKPEYVNQDAAALRAALLAQDIGLAAATHLRIKDSKHETQEVFRKLGVGK